MYFPKRAERMRQCIRESHLSQAEIANKLGVTRQVIHSFVNNPLFEPKTGRPAKIRLLEMLERFFVFGIQSPQTVDEIISIDPEEIEELNQSDYGRLFLHLISNLEMIDKMEAPLGLDDLCIWVQCALLDAGKLGLRAKSNVALSLGGRVQNAALGSISEELLHATRRRCDELLQVIASQRGVKDCGEYVNRTINYLSVAYFHMSRHFDFLGQRVSFGPSIMMALESISEPTRDPKKLRNVRARMIANVFDIYKHEEQLNSQSINLWLHKLNEVLQDEDPEIVSVALAPFLNNQDANCSDSICSQSFNELAKQLLQYK